MHFIKNQKTFPIYEKSFSQVCMWEEVITGNEGVNPSKISCVVQCSSNLSSLFQEAVCLHWVTECCILLLFQIILCFFCSSCSINCCPQLGVPLHYTLNGTWVITNMWQDNKNFITNQGHDSPQDLQSKAKLTLDNKKCPNTGNTITCAEKWQ